MKTNTRSHLSILLAFLFVVGTSSAFAQFKPQTIRFWVANEATGLPFSTLIKAPLHPTVGVGTDFWVRSRKHWQQSLGTDLTMYYQRLSEYAVMLDAAYNLGYKFGFGLQTNLHTGVGYKRSFLPGDVYQFDAGKYTQTTHPGKPQMNIKLGAGLEYPLTPTVSLTNDYKIMAVIPYSDFLPFSAHTFIGVGMKVKLAK